MNLPSAVRCSSFLDVVEDRLGFICHSAKDRPRSDQTATPFTTALPQLAKMRVDDAGATAAEHPVPWPAAGWYCRATLMTAEMGSGDDVRRCAG